MRKQIISAMEEFGKPVELFEIIEKVVSKNQECREIDIRIEIDFMIWEGQLNRLSDLRIELTK